MKVPTWLLATILLLISSVAGSAKDNTLNDYDVYADEYFIGNLPVVNDSHLHFTNEWAVKMEGGPDVAQAVAQQKGFSYRGPVSSLEDTYVFVKDDHPQRHKREALHIHQNLVDDDRILWTEQQQIKRRTKRDMIDPELDPEMRVNQRKRPYVGFPEDNPDYSFEYTVAGKEESSEDYEEYEELNNRVQRAGLEPGPVLSFLLKLKGLSELSKFIKGKSQKNHMFNDEHWGKQWYLHYTHTHPSNEMKTVDANGAEVQENKTDTPVVDSIKKLMYRTVDMNVLPCYTEGLSGKGVRVSILDDGLERAHKDLKTNYDAEISYDVNDNDPDPTPQYNGQNSHGTRCAGEVAMEANNGECGVGIAYNAKIGGVRLLDGPVTDRIEAAAVGHAYNLVDIYSASWGPTDDGQTVDGPGRLVREALVNGVTKGRNGKGSIFVWASGNGGGKGDSCSCDGYVNSIYTLPVSSVTQGGKVPWYGEKCAATFTTTYSSGSIREQMIVATDLNSKCTDKHSGTSAAAPLAAGIVALLLEANPELTWRDVQHIVVLTSRARPLMAKSLKGWKMNGAGFFVNTRFGFGLMDAHAMVRASRTWVTTPEQQKCVVPFEVSNQSLAPGETVRIKIPMSCESVKYLEHTVLQVNINASARGNIEAYLESPMGTKVQMLYKRPSDKSKAGYKNWPILSVYTWNENPNGEWILEIMDTCTKCPPGVIGDISLTVYGTTEKPHYFRDLEISKLADKLEELAINDHSEEGNDFFGLRTLWKQVW